MPQSSDDDPHSRLDLRAAIEELVSHTPSVRAIYLFGSRVHRTRSLRSDIDLLVIGDGLSAAKMNVLQSRISPYLDVFIESGGTAISAANMSTIPAGSLEELLALLSAEPLWESGWVGYEDAAAQDVLADYAPIPTVAVVGAEHLSVSSVDYLFVTALNTEFQAAANAVGDTGEGSRADSLVSHRIGTIDSPDGPKSVAVLILPSIGMVAAALTTFRLLTDMDVGLVVLLGITGALQDDGVHLGDVVIPNMIFDYETAKATAEGDRLNPTIAPVTRSVYQRLRGFDFPAWGRDFAGRRPSPEPGRFPLVHVDRTMACGHKVMADEDRAALLRETDRKTLAIEMESFGIAEACRAVAPEAAYVVIKAITDWADASKNDAWHEYCSAAAAELAVDLIRSGAV